MSCVVDADAHDVVRVVGDRRRERTALQPEAAHEADADPAGGVVALDDGDLGEVARGIGDRDAVLRPSGSSMRALVRSCSGTISITRTGWPVEGTRRSESPTGAACTVWRTQTGTSGRRNGVTTWPSKTSAPSL